MLQRHRNTTVSVMFIYTQTLTLVHHKSYIGGYYLDSITKGFYTLHIYHNDMTYYSWCICLPTDQH